MFQALLARVSVTWGQKHSKLIYPSNRKKDIFKTEFGIVVQEFEF